MGRPKLLLPWGQTSVLGHLIRQWEALGVRQLSVVCASDDLRMKTELDRLLFPVANRIYNAQAERGMFSSIVCAAQWPEWGASRSHFAIILGDQPHLKPDALQQLVQFAVEHAEQVCQPARNGKRRHPVIFPKDVFLKLAGSGCQDLKEFLAGHRVAVCECDDPGLDLDIDRPEDYQKALVLAGLGATT